MTRSRGPDARSRAVRSGFACLVVFLFIPLAWAGDGMFVVHDRVLHPVDGRLFGQFLERASWGEPGPELVVDPQTGALPEAVTAKLEAMRIPVIRFPGGSDVDRIDWTDMIDNVPGRAGPRPVTVVRENTISNRFGYDEYFALRDRLGCETIIVLNLLDGLSKKRSIPDAALHAAGLVAYCNAAVGATLPEGMPDWPAVRARNGHPEPYRVEYVQLGNEWWARGYQSAIRSGTGLEDESALAGWYVDVLTAFIRAIRAVDPTVALIVDGRIGRGIERMVLEHPSIRENVRYVALHCYAPGPLDRVHGESGEVDAATLSLEDWWYGCVAIPGTLSEGLNVGLGSRVELARELGYRVACTEWNWNGWAFRSAGEPFASQYVPIAQGLGAAGFLHGLMRQGDRVDMATQSMLLGGHWGITAVRVDPTGKTDPYYLPQGLATMFYNLHHGDRLLAVDRPELPVRMQAYTVGRWTTWPSVQPEAIAYIDLLVTADARHIYVHAINRHLSDAQDIGIDLRELGITDAECTVHRYVEGKPLGDEHQASPQRCRLESGGAPVRQGRLSLQVPPRSAAIAEVPRQE